MHTFIHNLLLLIIIPFLIIPTITSDHPKSPKSSPLPSTLTELLSTVQTDGIIYGNPLLYPECANALAYNHDMHQLSNQSLVTPWFWSRETISAAQLQLPLHRRAKIQARYNPNPIYPVVTSQQLIRAAQPIPGLSHTIKFFHRRIAPHPNIKNNYKVNNIYTEDSLYVIPNPVNRTLQPYLDTFDHVTVYGENSYSWENLESSLEKFRNFQNFESLKKFQNFSKISKNLESSPESLKNLPKSGSSSMELEDAKLIFSESQPWNKYFESIESKKRHNNHNLNPNNLIGNAMYYSVEKAGSSSLKKMVQDNFGFMQYYVTDNSITHCDCGFTFIRDPVSRFISGYYTVNQFFRDIENKGYGLPQKLFDKFKFWRTIGEPQRVMAFIDDLEYYNFDFTVTSPLEHMMTQTAILSVGQNDIHFIGRLENLMEHWDKLVEYCGIYGITPVEQAKRMVDYGRRDENRDKIQQNRMGLTPDKWHPGDILPAYLIIAQSYQLYQRIVQIYKQDYICFGMKHDYYKFKQKIMDKYNAQQASKKTK